MARKRGKGFSGEQFKFVRCPMSPTDREHFKENLTEYVEQSQFAYWQDLVGKGYKFSLSFNKERGSFVASVSRQTSDAGYVLTAWSSSSQKAVACLYYKFVQLLGSTLETEISDEIEDDFG